MVKVNAPYPKYKLALFALLTLNAIYYGVADTLGRALDSGAWLVLLVLFELETEFGWHERIRQSTAAIHLARLAAIAAASVATLMYFIDLVWLDTINAVLWTGVIVLLEWEVRSPAMVAVRKREFIAATGVLYAGLAILVLVWAWTGAWFDAYDALLWLVAYATIEVDVFKFSQQASFNQPEPN